MPPITPDDIKQVVRLQLGARRIEEPDYLVEDLGAESADIANIVAALEARTGVRISENELVKIRQVSDLVRLFVQSQ